MLLTEGETSDYKGAALTLADLPKAKLILGDRRYNVASFRAPLAGRHITACIPSKINHKEPIPTITSSTGNAITSTSRFGR
jgi:hypothetical protein